MKQEQTNKKNEINSNQSNGASHHQCNRSIQFRTIYHFTQGLAISGGRLFHLYLTDYNDFLSIKDSENLENSSVDVLVCLTLIELNKNISSWYSKY